AAREQLVVLEHGRADLAVAVAPQHLAGAGLGPLPALDLAGQEVAGAARRLMLDSQPDLLAAEDGERDLGEQEPAGVGEEVPDAGLAAGNVRLEQLVAHG